MKIKEIASFNPKGKKPNDYINYVDTSSVEDGKIVGLQTLSKDIPSRAQRVIEKNDILISSVRPILKHNFFVGQSIQHGVASTGFIHIRVNNSNVLPRFLYYYLTVETKIQQYQTIAETSQSTFPSFNKDLIEEMEFPNISLETQQHIVDILGSIDEKIEFYDKQKASYIKLGELLYEKILRSSTSQICFEEVFSFTNGYSFKSKDYTSNGTHKVITIKNITENGFSAETADAINYNLDFQKQLLLVGDILLTMTGDVGRAGIVDEENCLLNQRVLKVDSFSKFFSYFTLIVYSEEIKSLAKGSVQQNLGLKELNKMQIPFGEKNSYLQYDFIINKLIEISKNKAKLKELKQLYLKKFFG